MVRLGEISEEEAQNHPDKNIITRAIGAKTVEVDIYEYRNLKKDDIILMCTDGLSNMVEDEEYSIDHSDPEADIDQKGSALLMKQTAMAVEDNIGITGREPLLNEVKTW